uniref:Coiled-coil-helix-coiled-coil-helix domain containing 3b n=1 Tax=Sinocyclocheilus anshuiensis TaxID=1608454 RepID=A0A671NYJ3_9TELE
MKVPPPVVRPQATTKSSTQSTTVASPVERLVSGELHVPIIPHPPSYASTLVPPPPLSEPVTPFVPLVPVTEETSAPPSPVKSPEGLPTPPPTGDEHVAILVPDSQPVVLPADPMNVPSQESSEPLTASPLVEPSIEHLTPPPTITSTAEPITLSSCNLAAQPTAGKLSDLPVDPETSPSTISISAPIPSVLEESAVSSGSVPHLPQVEEPVAPSFIDQLEVFPPQTHVVDEEKLRKQIREDFQKLLKEEMKMAERNIRQQLQEEKAKAKAQAQAAARLQIQEEVWKLLEEEKASYQQTLADAVRREQLNVQDERLITQCYAQKLEEKEKDLENQDALFREQIAKMQEKTAQFTKVTAENYKKGLEDAHNRFRRYQIKPACSDLQSQILKCYTANKGRTMRCSNIASLYIQCVDRAKQDKKLSTGG